MSNVFEDKIFAASAPTFSDEEIKLFTEVMINGSTRSKNLKAGVTYLGQMIAHELVSSTSMGGVSRRPYFNLDSIYGVEDSRYDNFFDDNGKFILGNALNASGEVIKGFDLPRDRNTGAADIADPRNDENIIISQMHLMWMKLHNKILTKEDWPKGTTKNQKVTYARAYVCRIFQVIVFEEFVKKVIDPLILKEFLTLPTGTHLLNDANLKKAPDLFAHALFRFGHSMVLDAYSLKVKQGRSFSLQSLFFFVVGKPGLAWFIRKRHIIKWKAFFDKRRSDTAQKAAKIDHIIAFSMMKAPVGAHQVSIVESNVMAGMNSKLPNAGQLKEFLSENYSDYAKKMGIFNCRSCDIPKKLKDENYTADNLPLWLFVLIEAHNDNGTSRLGNLTSCLILEVLFNALRHADAVHQIFPGYLNNHTQAMSAGFPNHFLRTIALQDEQRLSFLDVSNYAKR